MSGTPARIGGNVLAGLVSAVRLVRQRDRCIRTVSHSPGR